MCCSERLVLILAYQRLLRAPSATRRRRIRCLLVEDGRRAARSKGIAHRVSLQRTRGRQKAAINQWSAEL